MRLSVIGRRASGVACAPVLLVALLGCSIEPSQLTLPGAGVRGPTYPVHIQLANALNLPAGAKVMSNGARVGTLAGVTVVDPSAAAPGYATIEVDIQKSVMLPSSVRVQLRQDTVLGDIYIALDSGGPDHGAPLPPGGTVPVTQTEPALQIEDVITGLATFVSGGALQSAQHVVEQINAALPPDPADTARMASALKNDLIDVAANLDASDAFLAAVSTNVKTVQDNRDALDTLLTPEGAATITAIAQSLIHTVGIVGAIGGIAHALVWITPLVRAGDAAAKAFVPLVLAAGRPLNLSAPSNLNRVVSLLRDKLIPFFERGPELTVTGLHAENQAGPVAVPTDEQVDNMIGVLRMIGMVR
ncbi:MlaD family protein [Nocardia sp. NPDC006630]|uniref:MlaD family protein n=1 Tax=Nocardia sp. NPDC006630 TaxID=3157181 RepID=UPI0033A1D2C1